MKKDSAKFDLLKRYLLGQLPEEKMQSIEQQYLANESFFDQLLNAETELITQYQSGQLSPEEHKQFESYFLRSDERRDRVREQTKLIASDSPTAELGFKSWWQRWLRWLGFRR